MSSETRFSTGQMVFLRADPGRMGPIIEVLAGANDATRYRVFHSPTNIAEYFGEQLVACQEAAKGDPLREALSRGEFLPPEVFRARLTAARLAHPLTDTIYALTSARIQFIPFQFKPLLRFLRSDRPRILIADEVGVGKTIEAGLILTELQARQKLDNVLVVCPKALVTKWQRELRRFDERFHILDSSSLKYCLRETHNEGCWPHEFRKAIVPLEILRRLEHLEGDTRYPSRKGLMQLSPPPSFDLLIVDEAHHVRSPGTLSHQSIRYLCEVSVAVVFLTATPVHLGSENLFHLLSLLRGDLFLSMEVFREMMEPARHILQASRCARSTQPDWNKEVLEHLNLAARTRWGQLVLAPDPQYQEWLRVLSAGSPLVDEVRVRCLRDVEEFHPLSGVINRTRRRDIGRFTIREPHTVSIDFSPRQQEFYDQLLEFRRHWLLQKQDPLVVRLILDTLERQAASCLPALAATLDSFLLGKNTSLEAIADGWDQEEEDLNLPASFGPAVSELRLLGNRLAQEPDPKLERFIELVSGTVGNSDGPGKLLVFSFFINTLQYLRKNLTERGYRVELIIGKTPEPEREQFRDRFSLSRDNPKAIDVLLSSEVGCEGLDYQFCDRMVNYDIPWNPMRIEQRIGRIDRFGQESDKVQIFNFITPGTVEERIFFRCFDRLGVFHDTLGDLEGVLGDLTQDLSGISMDGKLSPAQKEEKARQVSDNALRRVEEERRLEDDGELLLGLGSQMDHEVEELRRVGRYVDAIELHRMIQLYLKNLDGCSLSDIELTQCCKLGFARKEGVLPLLLRLKELEQSDAVQSFRRFLEQPGPHTLTFDQATAASQRGIEFVTPIHPLARLAVQYWEGKSGALTGEFALPETPEGPASCAFLLELWESVGVRVQIHLVGAVWNLELDREEADLGERLLGLICQATAKPAKAKTEVKFDLEKAFGCLEESLTRRRKATLTELRQKNRLLAERQVASLDTYYRNRLSQVDQELLLVKEERVVRMKQSERQRLEADHASKRRELLAKQDADILSKRIAAGTLVRA